ncbi:hypothetical protein JCM11491_004207 [Sporobolomyces phaffii]
MELSQDHGVNLTLRQITDALHHEASRIAHGLPRLAIPPAVLVSGPCAIALRIFGSHNRSSRDRRSDRETELDHLAETVRFPRDEIPIVFEVVGGIPHGNSFWIGSRDVLVQQIEMSHAVPSNSARYKGWEYPVVSGPFLLFDLIETFVHRVGLWHFAHEDIKVDGIRSSIVTFVLLVHSMMLTAACHPSPDFHTDPHGHFSVDTYHAMIWSPRFTSVRPFIQWFCRFEHFDRYSHVAARYVATQGYRPAQGTTPPDPKRFQRSVADSLVRVRSLLANPFSADASIVRYWFQDKLIFADLEHDFASDPFYDRPPPYEQSFGPFATGGEHEFDSERNVSELPGWRRQKSATTTQCWGRQRSNSTSSLE